MTRLPLVTALALATTACALEPPQRPPQRARPITVTPAPAKPSTDVYAYPLKAQSSEQQDRDRYECYLWSTKQTGFDPSAPNLAPHQRVRVIEGPPAGATTAAGAFTGAVLGAAVSSPHNDGEGAVVGAVAGAMIGAAAESQQAQRVARSEDEQTVQQRARAAELEQQATNYRRALSACLEPRGYSVR